MAENHERRRPFGLSPSRKRCNTHSASIGLFFTLREMGQTPPMPAGRLLLVLPFDNRTDQPNLDWISEAVPEVLNRRLASAGFMPISRDDRLYALDHLGLPPTFQPSRASAIRLAQTLDADYVIVGSFSTSGSRFQAKAQILKMDALHMSAPIQEEADMTHLLDVLNSLAWAAGEADRSAIRRGPEYLRRRRRRAAGRRLRELYPRAGGNRSRGTDPPLERECAA